MRLMIDQHRYLFKDLDVKSDVNLNKYKMPMSYRGI